MMADLPSSAFEDKMGVLRQIATALERLFSPLCEVVIHDFTDLDHSIICIAGNLSNRSIGGAATDLLLHKLQQGETDEDLYSYLTTLPGGRVLKSSTVFLRDDAGRVMGAFCVNFDISAFTVFHKQLGEIMHTEETGEVSENLSDDLRVTIQALLAEALHEMGSRPILSREDKISLMGRLSEKGVFQVKKAVPIIAELLGLSRATVYNYLREAGEDRELANGAG